MTMSYDPTYGSYALYEAERGPQTSSAKASSQLSDAEKAALKKALVPNIAQAQFNALHYAETQRRLGQTRGRRSAFFGTQEASPAKTDVFRTPRRPDGQQVLDAIRRPQVAAAHSGQRPVTMLPPGLNAKVADVLPKTPVRSDAPGALLPQVPGLTAPGSLPPATVEKYGGATRTTGPIQTPLGEMRLPLPTTSTTKPAALPQPATNATGQYIIETPVGQMTMPTAPAPTTLPTTRTQPSILSMTPTTSTAPVRKPTSYTFQTPLGPMTFP